MFEQFFSKMPDEEGAPPFITNSGRELKIGDCVSLLPADPEAEHYIARVNKLFQDQSGKCQMQIRWFYRPHELKHEPFSTPHINEVYHTNYVDTQSVETVIGNCKVLSESEYQAIKESLKEDCDGKVYFCRYSYSAETGCFSKLSILENHFGRAVKRPRTEGGMGACLQDLIKALVELERTLPEHRLPSFWKKERSEWMTKALKSSNVNDLIRHMLELEDKLQLLPSIGKADAKSRSAWIKSLTVNQNPDSLFRNIEHLRNSVLQRCQCSPVVRKSDRLKNSEMKQQVQDCTKISLLQDSASNETGNDSQKFEASIRVGSFYLISHKLLPPNAPTELKYIRQVLLSEKTDSDITIKFPSIISLQRYFSGNGKQESSAQSRSNENARQSVSMDISTLQPELDEQFIMSLKLAESILTERIAAEEFDDKRIDESFWLSNPLSQIARSNSGSRNSDRSDRESPIAGARDIAIQWGLRRKVKFNRKHRSQADVRSWKDETQTSPEISSSGSPRKRGSKRLRVDVNSNGARCDKEIATILKLPKDMQGRWNSERYKGAQLKLLDIMHEKEAIPGKPILRPSLREEARKHIGDTGLLDHLLKHMTDTVVRNGERFRRRHNSEGAMEYWLEPEELMEIRKQARIEDPFWVPPPGWKPGDEIPAGAYARGMTPSEAQEMKYIKEQIAEIQASISKLMSMQPMPTVPGNEDFKLGTTVSYVKIEEDETIIKEHPNPETDPREIMIIQKDSPSSTNACRPCTVTARLEKLEKDTRKYFKETDEKYQGLVTDIKSLESRLETVSSSVSKLQENMKQVLQFVALLSGKFSHTVTDPGTPRSVIASLSAMQAHYYNDMFSTDKEGSSKADEKNNSISGAGAQQQNAGAGIGFRRYKPDVAPPNTMSATQTGGFSSPLPTLSATVSASVTENADATAREQQQQQQEVVVLGSAAAFLEPWKGSATENGLKETLTTRRPRTSQAQPQPQAAVYPLYVRPTIPSSLRWEHDLSLSRQTQMQMSIRSQPQVQTLAQQQQQQQTSEPLRPTVLLKHHQQQQYQHNQNHYQNHAAAVAAANPNNAASHQSTGCSSSSSIPFSTHVPPPKQSSLSSSSSSCLASSSWLALAPPASSAHPNPR